jgi:hypothetical protein
MDRLDRFAALTSLSLGCNSLSVGERGSALSTVAHSLTALSLHFSEPATDPFGFVAGLTNLSKLVLSEPHNGHHALDARLNCIDSNRHFPRLMFIQFRSCRPVFIASFVPNTWTAAPVHIRLYARFTSRAGTFDLGHTQTRTHALTSSEALRVLTEAFAARRGTAHGGVGCKKEDCCPVIQITSFTEDDPTDVMRDL